jgi:hypothetical protein
LAASCVIFNQFSTNPLPLIVFIDGQVGEVGAISEIGDSSRDSDQQASGVSRGSDHVGILEHRGDGRIVVDWPSFGQTRTP